MNFEEICKINVNDYINQKQGLSYLSWSYAWKEFKKIFPNAIYEIKMFEGKPYIYDEKLGYMVFTSVTVDNLTHEMWLPVMDSSNKAMKDKDYQYKTKYETKTCLAATMFDINKTIMRCLVKNLAMFGLGLYIYNGEDLPEDSEEQPIITQEVIPSETKVEQPTQQAIPYEEKKISEAQRKLLFARCNKKGMSEEEIKNFIGTWGYTSTADIPAKEFNKILTELGE